jgi:DNA repair exonuclease SbcCD ATPase subunit
VTAQLAAAQQRVAELTPLTKDAANLWTRETEARQHTDEAEKMSTYLSERSRKGDEEATQIKKERDELLQRDAKAPQWILDLLGEVEKERNIKLGVKEKLTALEMRPRQDAAMIERLRKEQDGLSQTMERLRSERNTASQEHDQAC